MSLLLLQLLAAPQADAAPGQLVPRASNTSSSNSQSPPPAFGVQIWAPLVAIVVVIFAMISFACLKRRRLNSATPRQLTANQLAGTTPTSPTTAAARRTRRQRRTPSQISTRSLPAYMEDPGDSEMVLARGIPDMDDPMPTVVEDGGHSHSVSSLGDFNVSSPHTPLLRTDATPHHLTPPADAPHPNASRASFDTVHMGSEDSQHALLTTSNSTSTSGHPHQPHTEELQARGDAPPYVEMEMAEIAPAQSQSQSQSQTSPQTSPQAQAPAQPSPPTRSAFRRSLAARLSQLLPSSSMSPSIPPVPTPAPAHARSPSASTTTSTIPPSRTHTRTPTLSHTRSLLSLRSLASTAPPNPAAASTASLNISAPLPHTLTRTTFVYPSGGPTSEQMKFISSRETVGRFGVPWGEAARARSGSRSAADGGEEGGEDPPPFEDRPGASRASTRDSGASFETAPEMLGSGEDANEGSGGEEDVVEGGGHERDATATAHAASTTPPPPVDFDLGPPLDLALAVPRISVAPA